jgi:hypothetical protein
MFVGYVMIGALTGTLAGTAALVAGYTFGTAFLIYVLAGLIGTGFGALTLLFPSARHMNDGFADPQNRAEKV